MIVLLEPDSGRWGLLEDRSSSTFERKSRRGLLCSEQLQSSPLREGEDLPFPLLGCFILLSSLTRYKPWRHSVSPLSFPQASLCLRLQSRMNFQWCARKTQVTVRISYNPFLTLSSPKPSRRGPWSIKSRTEHYSWKNFFLMSKYPFQE